MRIINDVIFTFALILFSGYYYYNTVSWQQVFDTCFRRCSVHKYKLYNDDISVQTRDPCSKLHHYNRYTCTQQVHVYSSQYSIVWHEHVKLINIYNIQIIDCRHLLHHWTVYVTFTFAWRFLNSNIYSK